MLSKSYCLFNFHNTFLYKRIRICTYYSYKSLCSYTYWYMMHLYSNYQVKIGLCPNNYKMCVCSGVHILLMTVCRDCSQSRARSLSYWMSFGWRLNSQTMSWNWFHPLLGWSYSFPVIIGCLRINKSPPFHFLWKV